MNDRREVFSVGSEERGPFVQIGNASVRRGMIIAYFREPASMTASEIEKDVHWLLNVHVERLGWMTCSFSSRAEIEKTVQRLDWIFEKQYRGYDD